MSMADTRFETRRRRLASGIAAQRVDGLLITHMLHVRYFSGFTGSNGALIVFKDRSARIATDGRYTTQIAAEVPDIEATITRQLNAELIANAADGYRIGYEADYVSVTALEKLKKACPEGVSLVPVTGVVEPIRLTKDNIEIKRLAEAAELSVEALSALIESGGVRAGRTERDIAADLEFRMRMLGAERPSFDTIIASGPNSAMPHHAAGDRVLEQGDLVTIDFGMHRLGYNSDMTRTFAIGEPDDFLREIYEVTLASQLAGVRAATPGAALSDIDRACREVIDEAGFGEYFVHSTGHGVGLEVHESPYAASTGTGELEKDMTLTIEPGIYVPGRGGVRIEDTLVITSGAPRVITEYPKDLIVL